MVGLGAAALTASYCFGGCNQNDQNYDGPNPIDFMLDLTLPAYAALNNNGGYIYNARVIVARTLTGAYIAVSQACTHAGATVDFDAANSQFHCASHGSNFRLDGTVSNGPAGSPLRRYNTALTGTSLRVFS